MLFAMTLIIIGLIEGIYLEIEEFSLISQKFFLRRTKQCLLENGSWKPMNGYHDHSIASILDCIW